MTDMTDVHEITETEIGMESPLGITAEQARSLMADGLITQRPVRVFTYDVAPGVDGDRVLEAVDVI